jgi:hypothetical protein
MNKLIFKVLFLSLSVLFVSCKKEYVYPSDTHNIKEESVIDGGGNTITQWGKFLILDAVMYVENKETGQKNVYNHFYCSNCCKLQLQGSCAGPGPVKDSLRACFYGVCCDKVFAAVKRGVYRCFNCNKA